ncbi:MAG: RibD family protein [Wenzhouxiangella sp.]|nr:RibD family protein [Wenzhouxiangella sp.]
MNPDRSRIPAEPDFQACWQALLDLREVTRTGPGPWQARGLTLYPDGRWDAAFHIEPHAAEGVDLLAPLIGAPACVVGQLGQSLDGRIATVTGDSHYINARAAREHLHRLRALVDAVVVGVGTAEADRPQLTTRLVEGPSPARVVIDPRGRMSPDGPLIKGGGPEVIQLVGPGVDVNGGLESLRRVGIPMNENGMAPTAIVSGLSRLGFKRILIEGGANTVSRFVDADALDRLHLLIAPLLIGSGRSGLELPPIESLADARRPPMRAFSMGGELIVDLDLRDR